MQSHILWTLISHVCVSAWAVAHLRAGVVDSGAATKNSFPNLQSSLESVKEVLETFGGARKAVDATETLESHDGSYHRPELWYMPSANLAVCACLKCGSTSLYKYMYAQVFGHAWEYHGEPSVQKLDSSRWKGAFKKVSNLREEAAIMNSSSTYSFALIRDPRERLVSAWKDKASCDSEHLHPDARNRDIYVPIFLRLADMDWGTSSCLSLEQFLKAYAKIQSLGRTNQMNRHFLPQHLDCFNNSSPAKWSKIATIQNDQAIARMTVAFPGVPALTLDEQHVTRHGYTISEEAFALLNEVTAEEYAYLSPYLGLAGSNETRDTTNRKFLLSDGF